MGMYNEVFCRCPECGSYAYMQISQIVLGFGGFYLDQPETMADLDDDELIRLREAVAEDPFRCEPSFPGDDDEDQWCGHTFNPYWEDNESSEKLERIKQLFRTD